MESSKSKKNKTNKTKITAWNEFRNLAKCAVCGSNMVIVQSHLKRKVESEQNGNI